MHSVSNRILYEDNHLIIVNKLAGEIVQGDKTGDEPLSETIKKYIKEKYNKPGEVFMGVVHRLDRPTSGLVIFAKTSKALSRMNEIFRDREVKKIYWAICKSTPKKTSDRLINYLVKNEKTNTSRAVEASNKSALKAELEYTLLKKSDNYSLLEVELFTGRHHQIRVQLSTIGCPIKGDLKYGSDRSNSDGSISLHARKIIFTHPVKKEKIELIAPVPNDSLWQYFEKE
ncbi:MAG: RluA family pseudouridine synthase [Bacteroidota bacterium]